MIEKAYGQDTAYSKVDRVSVSHSLSYSFALIITQQFSIWPSPVEARRAWLQSARLAFNCGLEHHLSWASNRTTGRNCSPLELSEAKRSERTKQRLFLSAGARRGGGAGVQGMWNTKHIYCTFVTSLLFLVRCSLLLSFCIWHFYLTHWPNSISRCARRKQRSKWQVARGEMPKRQRKQLKLEKEMPKKIVKRRQ